MPSARLLATGFTVAAGVVGTVAIVGGPAVAADEPAGAHAGHGGVRAAANAPMVVSKAKTTSVRLVDYAFKPSRLTVRRNTTVRFVWTGRDSHNARVTKGPAKFNSGFKTSGSYTRKLTKKGTYTIVCDPHLPDMKMTVVVK
jgi:plastocyanin